MRGSMAFQEERCVMCGEVIPEGRQVCIACEEEVLRGTKEATRQGGRDYLELFQRNLSKVVESGSFMKKMLMTATLAPMIGQFNMGNIQMLLDLGYEVHVAANFREYSYWPKGRVKKLAGELKGLGVKLYQVDYSRNPWDVRKLVRSFRQLRGLLRTEKFAFVHCHTPVAGVVSRICCCGYEAKVMYTAHGFHFYKGAPWRNWLFYFTAEWLCSWMTDVLVTMNGEDFARAKKHLHAGKTEYVPGVGVDVGRFRRAPCFDVKAKRDKIGMPQDATVLLSVGALHPDKNQQTVIKALAKLNRSDIHYCIAGAGAELRGLEELVESLNVQGNVHFLGHRGDIPELLWACDLFVFPSVFEGLPVALMEAMAAGVPIACSSCRGNTDLIKDRRYQFKYDSVDGCAAAIQYALSHDNAEFIKGNKKRLLPFQKGNALKEIKRIYKEIDGSIQA